MLPHGMNSFGPASRRALAHLASSILAAAPLMAADLPAPLWVQQGRPTPQAQELLNAMREAEVFGLDPRDFAPDLTRIEAQRTLRNDAAFDELVTKAATRFVRELHEGRIDPQAAGYVLSRRREKFDAGAALRQLSVTANVGSTLATFEPDSAQYHALKRTLDRYRHIPASSFELPPLPARKIEPGDTYDGCGKLRELLLELGDLEASTTAQAASCDDALFAALSRFQQRHGLTPDGILGARTFAALTVPIAQRIRQIELTMERWRWLPRFQAPAVIINVPQYMLYTLPRPGSTDSLLPGRIPVIVGAWATQTPIFDSVIESVVFRPYWNVPRSIVRNELLAPITRDPTYLERHDMEIVRGDGDDALVLPAGDAAVEALRAGKARLRQRPGPGNSLGLIKFVLPNPYSVYLHSTPQTRLFERESRAFSHGCVRVSDSSALAAYLLAETPSDNEGEWDVQSIEAATCGSNTFTVRLAKPVPVFILYGTVVVDSDGAVLFFQDVYGYDQRLEKLLSSRTIAP